MSRKKISTKMFIEKAKNVHGDKYDYSLVKYIKSNQKVKIICKIHNVFEQIANNHLKGQGCLKCQYLNNSIKNTSNSNSFIRKAISVHKNIYNYDLVEYKNSKTKIICNKHGIFKQRPNDHLAGKGCPKCKLSKGEIKIEQYLNENNIQYETQKTFNECVNILKLPFDFYISEYNICIEYDGQQHFKSIKYFGGVEGFKKKTTQ